MVRRIIEPWFWRLLNLVWITIVSAIFWDDVASRVQQVVAAPANTLLEATGFTVGQQTASVVMLFLYVTLGGLIGLIVGSLRKICQDTERHRKIQKAMGRAWQAQEARDLEYRPRPAWHDYLDVDD